LPYVSGAVVATAAATVLGAATAAVVSAAPGPITVLQSPATGTAVSGLLVPSPWPAPLQVDATETPGEVRFSVPVTPEICATTIGSALVRVDFTNPGAASGGSTVINPCGHPVDPAPAAPMAHTGSGLVNFTSAIIGSPAYPRAGQPAIPGAGSFTVP
jgi:hypothetical protein